MNPTPSPWIIIDSPELKTLFAPKQAADEVFNPKLQQWESVHDSDGFCQSLPYRRLARLAWLPIKERFVQYPAWLAYEGAAQTGWEITWAGQRPLAMVWTHWLPAPPAPEPPSSEDDDEAFMEFLRSQAKYGEILTAALAKQLWQAGRTYEKAKATGL